MKRTLMIGVAAGALLAGVNFAAAQMERQQMPGASGGASVEQKGAVQKKGGEMKAQGGTELKAQGGTELKGSKARAQAPAEQPKAGGEMKAQEQKPGAQPKAGTSAQTDQKSGAQPKAGTSAQGDMKAGGSATSGQGAGGGAKASLTTEQKTKIRETVLKSGPRVSKTNINFSLSVGTVVPRTVRFAVLPPILVEIYPEWRGYEYFIVEDEIISSSRGR